MVRIVAAVLSAAFMADCVIAKSAFLTAEAPDYNNKVVDNLLGNIHSVRGKGEAYAVFDWDNTCMFGDISYTAVFYQVDNLDFRFTPQQLKLMFSRGLNASNGDTCLSNGIHSKLGDDVYGTSVTLATALAETVKDYEVLYNAYIASKYHLVATASVTTVTLREIKGSREYHNFRAKLAFLLFGLEAMIGTNDHSLCSMTVAATIFPQLLLGMTKSEIQTLIRSSIRWNLGQALETPTYTSTGHLQVQGSYTKGLRFFSGQESTMRALRTAGVDVYIISASPQLFAAEAGNLFGLGNTVPNDNVYGVRFKFDAAGLFTGKLVDHYPITWGPGKATIVKSILKPMHYGAPPIYSSGDSDGDCEMMDMVRDGVVDTNNRLNGNTSCIHRFYVKACKYFGTTEPRTNNVYLLQGQDQVIGTWITSGFSTKDGITYESGVSSYDHCKHYQFLHL
ncbi:HAD-like domain [Plasmopara halstedii]|uniref:HAD-like domain n=1 Tax=Plasmopara halstedii TaxID=4781 RepID=A0A0N7L7K2_PLAHL|nr:HAD-like domain [Plasmopara halstedii]CEG47307.1 HAD-like domain [Plasmopara halstedii]|eukprot:XP_024583676.1 HAD-like domain [Plasmopara halstedii]